MVHHIDTLTGVNQLGLDLFAQEVARQPLENVLVSPPNLFLLLALLHAGARGETRHELAAALHCKPAGDHTADEVSTAIQAAVAPAPASHTAHADERSDQDAGSLPMVQLAAALWAARDLSFTSGYEDLARQIFGAESANLDFGSPSAVATMNAWVRANTAGYITDLFSTIDPLTVLCGATTLVFRGVWQAPFDRHWTRMGSFTRQDREPVLVPFMHQIGRFPYYEDDRVQAVALPIQHAPTDGREFDLIIILPKDPIPLVSLQSDLAAATRWSAWLACLDYVHRYRMLPYGLLAVPRFTITYGSQPNLNATLGALSIKHLFNPASADLTAMLVSPSSTPLPVFLSSLLHRTLLSVEEKGVTAAAASGVIYETGSPPPLNFVMQVDRPFLCAIWERTSELLLFLGAVNDPSNQP